MSIGCRASNKPMGGLQVIFTGDFFQLPPVLKSKPGSNTTANFNSNIQITGNDVCIQDKQIMIAHVICS